MKRGSACAVRQQNIQAGLTLMAPPFTREMIFSFLLLRSGHEVESAQAPGLVLASRQQTTSTSCAATQRRCPLCSWSLNPPLPFGRSLMWHVTMHLKIHIPAFTDACVCTFCVCVCFVPSAGRKLAWIDGSGPDGHADAIRFTYFSRNYG